MISDDRISAIPTHTMLVYVSLKKIIPLNVVSGMMLNISKDDIPAVANLNPNVIKHCPINPMLHILHKISVEFIVKLGNDSVFGIIKINEEKK